MSKEKDVNTEGHDELTEDLSDFASSDEELETHNPDIDEYDEILRQLEASDTTTEDETPGEAKKTDESTEGDDDDEEPGTKDGEDARIPKSRLDEVISQRDSEKNLRLEAEGKIAHLEDRLSRLEAGKKEEPQQTTLPLDDLLSGEPQALVDSFTEDPAGFVKNLEARIEAKNKLEYEQRKVMEESERELRGRLDEFAAKHDDFLSSIPKFGETLTRNPIHNAISAYYEIVKVPALEAQVTDLQGKIEGAKAEGIKQGRKEAIEAIRAKGLAATLDGSSGSAETPAPDSELDDTESAGGIRSVLNKQLVDRRKARGLVD